LNIEDERIQTLMDLGLTFCQAKVYLALVPNGSCTAKTLSRLSKVTRQDIYRIMPTLQKLGLAQKILTIPTGWEATPIDEGLAILLEHKNKQFSELQKKTTKLLNKFKKHKKRTEWQEEWEEFVIIHGSETFKHWLNKKMEEVQNSKGAFVTWDLLRRVLFDELKQIKRDLKRGVKFRYIVYGFDEKNDEIELDPYLKKNPNFQIRYILNPPLAAIAVFDEKEVVFSSPTRNLLATPKLWSNNPHFVALIQEYFETKWETAQELSVM
jgi:sugar-specific transcriptional regulator TrmB